MPKRYSSKVKENRKKWGTRREEHEWYRNNLPMYVNECVYLWEGNKGEKQMQTATWNRFQAMAANVDKYVYPSWAVSEALTKSIGWKSGNRKIIL
tara:strand:- start:1171 stop:1455 length:285 start_codon:yes stop_codon:yes gene_type:complete